MAHTFSVHDGSLAATTANVSGIWWQNASSAGISGPVGFTSAEATFSRMQAGEPSVTAQRVAAHRLTFERVAADHGDPAADDRLARDVAGDTSVDRRAPMSAYLAARTAFFDRVVVGALAP